MECFKKFKLPDAESINLCESADNYPYLGVINFARRKGFWMLKSFKRFATGLKIRRIHEPDLKITLTINIFFLTWELPGRQVVGDPAIRSGFSEFVIEDMDGRLIGIGLIYRKAIYLKASNYLLDAKIDG